VIHAHPFIFVDGRPRLHRPGIFRFVHFFSVKDNTSAEKWEAEEGKKVEEAKQNSETRLREVNFTTAMETPRQFVITAKRA
jgi:hypothetical protein